MANNGAVIAAGAVVLRKGATGREVLLVHRPKYDDWSFPKGKQDPGEHITQTAVREVLEETGVEVRLGRPLAPQLYAVSGGRTKTVHYWVGHVLGDDDVSGYQINSEIDDLAWVPIHRAEQRLTYLDDIELLNQARKQVKRTAALVVVRHGRARGRKSWGKDDRLRPLTAVGKEQASALVPVLHAYGVTRLVTSPSKRCAQTLAPYAEAYVLPVEQWLGLSEEEEDVTGIHELVQHALAERESTAVCTHRPVLPDLMEALRLDEEPLAPSEFVVCHHRKGRIVATERHLVR